MELDIIKNYKEGSNPKETDFLYYIDFLKEELRDFREKVLIFAISALMIMGVLYKASKGNTAQTVDKLVPKEIVQKAKDSINVSPSLLFKH